MSSAINQKVAGEQLLRQLTMDEVQFGPAKVRFWGEFSNGTVALVVEGPKPFAGVDIWGTAKGTITVYRGKRKLIAKPAKGGTK